jgi:hypothetical protein
VILPKGEAIYEDLNTSFTDIDELMLDLRSNAHTGYVQIGYWQYSAILFMDSGTVINAVEESEDGKKTTGRRAVMNILEKTKQKDGTVSVYTLEPDMVTALAGVVKSKIVYGDLTTEFTDLEKLIGKLRDEAHTGFIEVTMNGGKGNGVILLRAGDPIQTILSTNGHVTSGNGALPTIVHAAANAGATFNVHRTPIDEALAESNEIMAGFDLPDLVSVWGKLIAKAEETVSSELGEQVFLNAFKDTLIDKADKYPFLDPFAAEFKYGKGKIKYTGSSATPFSEAVADCLTTTIARLDNANPEIDFRAAVRSQMGSLRKRYVKMIERFGILALLPDYLGDESEAEAHG